MSSTLDRIEDRGGWDGEYLHETLSYPFAPGRHIFLTEDEWWALVNVAKAAEEMFRRNDDETHSDAEVQEAHDLLREALAALNKEPA